MPENQTKMLPSRISTPKLKLKPLPENLKYAYLADDETLHIIISNTLTSKQEDKLIRVLRQNSEVLGWTLADLKGLSATLCSHKVTLESDAKPKRDPQWRLNPPIMEVAQKEILQCLDAGVIYHIVDSEWFSPIHVVPKKGGTIIVKNKKGELIATGVQSGWRVCIDYRKLNKATKKDHFSLSFMDQMLERLAGRSHYCFLDRYSGIFRSL